MKAFFLSVLISVLIIGCNVRPNIDYEVVENKKYDIPAKSQISKRIVLKDSIDNQQIAEVVNYEFNKAMKTRMKFHNPPSHVFVYVYSPGTDVEKESGYWVAMKSRIMNEDSEIKFGTLKAFMGLD